MTKPSPFIFLNICTGYPVCRNILCLKPPHDDKSFLVTFPFRLFLIPYSCDFKR